MKENSPVNNIDGNMLRYNLLLYIKLHEIEAHDIQSTDLGLQTCGTNAEQRIERYSITRFATPKVI